MNKINRSSLLALMLIWLGGLATSGLASQSLIVIRYDAELIRLNGEMINALFHEERLDDIRKTAKLTPKARLNVQFKTSVGEQPTGVLVGTLSIHSESDTSAGSLENDVIRELRDALNENLNTSFDELARRREVARENIQVAEKRLQATYSEMQHVERTNQLALQQESLQKLEARRLDKEIETRISDQRRELLRVRLKEAEASLAKRVASRDEYSQKLQQIQQAIQDLNLIVARESQAKKKDSKEANAKFYESQMQLESEARKLSQEAQEMAKAEAEIRVQLSKLSETYQKATMDMAVAENEKKQLAKLVALGRESAAKNAAKESVRQRLHREIQHLESHLASLRKTESDLRLQRDSMVPVQVRRWK